MRFHMYFNWLPTEADYKSYYKASQEKKIQNDPTILMEWEPRWYPHLEFQNMIEEHTKDWEEYPEEGCFRIQQFKDFGMKKGSEPLDGEWDCTKAKFLRAKLECEMTFAEELELQSFPFDCQDLSCIIHERTTGGVKCIFLPELRKPNFASIDPRYSVIDEWDMESARIEFGSTNAGSSRSATTYPAIILRLKMKRRWEVFMWNIVLLVLCIECLAITAFALDLHDEASDRLGLSITLVLTAVAFLHIVKSGLPNVPYLTFLDFYVLSSYVFLMSIMLETAILSGFDVPVYYDRIFMFICIGYQILYHIVFFFYSFYVRKQELLKLVMDSDSIEEEVNQSRPALAFDYTRGQRHGDKVNPDDPNSEGRLLFFKAFKKVPKKKDDDKDKDKKKKKNNINTIGITKVIGF
eukprot:504175_1